MKQNNPSLTAYKVAWKSFFDPISLVKDLKTIGFTQAEDIGPEKINALFFKNRAEKLMVGRFEHLMKARV